MYLGEPALEPPCFAPQNRRQLKLKGKKVVVTGADGFIGSHLTEHLVRAGADVTAFVLYNSFGHWGWLDDSPAEIRDSLRVVAGDIRDPHGVRAALAGADVVMHLAALIAIPYSYHSPDTYIETNIRGTLNVVQAARDLGIERVVHTSTSEVYGTARFVPITEEHPLQGQSPYSASKIGADQIAASFHASFDTPVATIRPFNTYGPRQSARAVIPTVIGQIASGSKTIQLGALTPTRDFNFVEDTVRGFVAVAEADAAVGDVINIGSGFEVSIGDMVKLVGEVMGVDVHVELDPARVRPSGSEVERLLACNAKAKEVTGWTPAFGGVEGFKRGLSQTSEWFSEPTNLARYKTGSYNV